jgi:hypothetical protein
VTVEGSTGRGRLLDWKAVLGFGISGGLLWFAFRDVHLAEVWHHVREADLVLLALAALTATTLFPLRAIRWRPLLQPALPRSRFHFRFAATCIGFMVNNLLPARVGEFARAYALSRLEPVKVSASFGTLVVERMFDGLTIVLLLLISMAWPGFPDVSGRDFGSAAAWMGGLFALVFLVLLGMVIRPETSVRLFERTIARVLPKTVRRPVVDALEAFLDGLGALRNGRLVAEIVFWSVVTWLTGALSFYIGFLAFGIQLPFVAALFVQGLIALAVALPSAPGFFGVFEAAARVGLVSVWGVASGPALAFAIGFHMAGFLPVTLLGLYYLWRLGISWRDVGKSEDAVESAVEASTAGPELASPGDSAR